MKYTARLTVNGVVYPVEIDPEGNDDALVAVSRDERRRNSILLGRDDDPSDVPIEALEDRSVMELHPDDAQRLGLADGEPAQLRTEVGSAILPVRITPHIAVGTVFVPFNNPGLRANTLLSGSFTTTVTIEAANGG